MPNLSFPGDWLISGPTEKDWYQILKAVWELSECEMTALLGWVVGVELARRRCCFSSWPLTPLISVGAALVCEAGGRQREARVLVPEQGHRQFVLGDPSPQASDWQLGMLRIPIRRFFFIPLLWRPLTPERHTPPSVHGFVASAEHSLISCWELKGTGLRLYSRTCWRKVPFIFFYNTHMRKGQAGELVCCGYFLIVMLLTVCTIQTHQHVINWGLLHNEGLVLDYFWGVSGRVI